MELGLVFLAIIFLAAMLFLGYKFREQTQRLSTHQTAQQIELENVRRLLEIISANTSDGFLLLTRDWHIAFANPTARTILGIENSLDKPLRDLAWGYELDPLVEQIQNSKIDVIDQMVTRNDRIFNAHVQRVDAPTQDVLIRLVEVTELQRLGRVRRDFVANISHELRTPVTSLQLLIETISGDSSNDRTALQNWLGKMRLQTDLLRQLTDELMDLALIESGQSPIKLVETHAKDLINDAVNPLRPQIELKNLQLVISVDPDTLVLADPEGIRKTLGNLIHNAIKFTNAGGRIEIRASRDGDNARFSVSDTGIGIPASDLPRIFERFYKVDRARVRGAGELRGTGLGLAIAKHIVGAHGGEIWVESIEGKGSTFYFTLPTAN